MASVWAAEDELLGRLVAVKMLSRAYAADERRPPALPARGAGRRAARRPPHVVTVYDIGEHDGRAFMVMEHFAGGTVADRLRGGDRRSRARWRCAGSREAASRSTARTRHDVVHRDVKPANLLLDEHGPPRGRRLRDRDASRARRRSRRPARCSAPRVHRPRAGPRPTRDRGERPLRARRRGVRAAHRRAPVQRRPPGRAGARPRPGDRRRRQARSATTSRPPSTPRCAPAWRRTPTRARRPRRTSSTASRTRSTTTARPPPPSPRRPRRRAASSTPRRPPRRPVRRVPAGPRLRPRRSR